LTLGGRSRFRFFDKSQKKSFLCQNENLSSNQREKSNLLTHDTTGETAKSLISFTLRFTVFVFGAI